MHQTWRMFSVLFTPSISSPLSLSSFSLVCPLTSILSPYFKPLTFRSQEPQKSSSTTTNSPRALFTPRYIPRMRFLSSLSHKVSHSHICRFWLVQPKLKKECHLFPSYFQQWLEIGGLRMRYPFPRAGKEYLIIIKRESMQNFSTKERVTLVPGSSCPEND